MARSPDVLNNTPWWLPDVTTGGAGSGVLVTRCSAYEERNGAGPRHLEGGFYGLESLGPHVWTCQARADGRYRMMCRCGHRGQVQPLCNGHVAAIRKRGSGVCPPCVHPAPERAIQEAMTRTRQDAATAMMRAPDVVTAARASQAAQSQLWDLQAQLDELVTRGIVHRCGLTLQEVS